MALIPQPVTLQFWEPISSLCFWDSAIPAGMQMPEAAVNENDGVQVWQHNIGFSRQGFNMHAKPVPERVENLANG